MDVFEKAQHFLTEIENTIIPTAESAEAYRIRFLGSKNVLKDLFAEMKSVPTDRKKEFGQLMNTLKTTAERRLEAALAQFVVITSNEDIEDLTLPGYPMAIGSRHPLNLVREQVIRLFAHVGFAVAEGPEIEDEWHNFSALNTPEDHPARDMTDTFYVQEDPARVLRSQTSTVQVRVMETTQPPIRIISPGRVYRNETISYKHHVFFHQLEGLYIDKKVSFADLKQCLYYFVEQFFGHKFELRLRPSFFPFTEPSAELDIRVKGTEKWMEILGCGMVHPNVLKNCNIDPDIYTGYAFGMGLERLAMLKYGIPDIRTFYENDLRMLREFGA